MTGTHFRGLLYQYQGSEVNMSIGGWLLILATLFNTGMVGAAGWLFKLGTRVTVLESNATEISTIGNKLDGIAKDVATLNAAVTPLLSVVDGNNLFLTRREFQLYQDAVRGRLDRLERPIKEAL